MLIAQLNILAISVTVLLSLIYNLRRIDSSISSSFLLPVGLNEMPNCLHLILIYFMLRKRDIVVYMKTIFFIRFVLRDQVYYDEFKTLNEERWIEEEREE